VLPSGLPPVNDWHPDRGIAVTPEARRSLIDEYAAGYAVVTAALATIPEPQWSARPIAGKWSAREIVLHLGDSEPIAAQRLRRLLTEPHPLIHGYDQERWAEVLRYNERDVAPALAAFEAARAGTLPLLRELSEDDWRRPGFHTE
jgi:hypothetical protein